MEKCICLNKNDFLLQMYNREETMIIPVRCFSCGKVVGHKWETYEKNIKDGMSAKQALDELSLTKYCCRRMFLGHVNVIDNLLTHCDDNAHSKELE